MMDDLGRRYGVPPSYWLNRTPLELTVDWMAAEAGKQAGIPTWPVYVIQVKKR